MSFGKLSNEIRGLISQHLTEWPDHKAFRQADKTNYRLLTDSQRVRKQFAEVDSKLLGEYLNSVFTNPSIASLISTALRNNFTWRDGNHFQGRIRTLPNHVGTGPAAVCAAFANLTNSSSPGAPKPAKDWLTFVYHNDYLASLRAMQDSNFLESKHLFISSQERGKYAMDFELVSKILRGTSVDYEDIHNEIPLDLEEIMHISGIDEDAPRRLSMRLSCAGLRLDLTSQKVLNEVEWHMDTILLRALKMVCKTDLDVEDEELVEDEDLNWFREWAWSFEQFVRVWAELNGSQLEGVKELCKIKDRTIWCRGWKGRHALCGMDPGC